MIEFLPRVRERERHEMKGGEREGEREKKFVILPPSEREREGVTGRDHEVVDFTRSRVKTKSKLTNLMKISRIEGYNGK